MASKTKSDGPVRILTDLATAEWFWLDSDAKTGTLSVSDTDSYSSEYEARKAAAEDHGIEVTELQFADANPTPDELEAEEAPAPKTKGKK